MNKNTKAPTVITVDLKDSVTLDYVGSAGAYAWVALSNGIKIELSKELLSNIVAGFNRHQDIQELLAQLA